MPRGRKSTQGLPPGIQRDGERGYFVRLEGEDAELFRARHPGRTVPRRRAKTLGDAVKLQRTMIDELKAQRKPDGENPKIADYVKAWIDGKRRLQASTAHRYRQSLRLYIAPNRIGRLRLHQLAREHINTWVSELEQQARHDDDERTLDPYTIRNAFAVLRAALNAAVRNDLITKNPCTGIELPQPDDEEIQPLNPAQVETLLGVVDTLDNGRPHRLAALYHVAVLCGLRQGEIIGLRESDLNLERCELRVAGQIQKGERKKAKTKRSHRTLRLSPATMKALRWHVANQREERQVAPEGWNGKRLIFCSQDGTPINPGNLTRQFKSLLKRADVPTIRFHDLRHTYAALSIAAGVNIYTLSRRMGHSSITVTADTYGHLFPDQTGDDDALDRLVYRRAA